MKVKTVVTFKDVKAKKLRKEGEEFECSKERYEEILEKGKYVEPVVEETQEADSTPDEAEVAPVQPKAKTKAAKSGKQAKKEEDGDL